jgi:hypothetical protein
MEGRLGCQMKDAVESVSLDIFVLLEVQATCNINAEMQQYFVHLHLPTHWRLKMVITQFN